MTKGIFEELMAAQIREIMTTFVNRNLPPHLLEVVEPLAACAEKIAWSGQPNTHKLMALQRLVEAKDAAVRDRISQPSG